MRKSNAVSRLRYCKSMLRRDGRRLGVSRRAQGNSRAVASCSNDDPISAGDVSQRHFASGKSGLDFG